MFQEVIASGFSNNVFIEFDRDDNLYVVDHKFNLGEVYKITPLGEKTVLAEISSGPIGIAIPPAADNLTAVHVIDTISTAGIDLDQPTFSYPPIRVETDIEANQTVIEWRFESFDIGQIENLSFEVVLKGLIPGEDKVV